MPMLAPPLEPIHSDTAADRRSYFHCFLADQPSYLVPDRLLPAEAEQLSREPLKTNPRVWFSWRDVMPSSITYNYPLSEHFRRDTGLIWVEDPVLGVQTPFWAGPWFQRKLAGLSRGQAAPDLSARHQWVLYLADVLAPPGELPSRAARRQQILERASREFRINRFAALAGLIHPFHIGSLRSYYRRVLRTGGMKLGDSGSDLRFVIHNDGVARFFHRHIAKVVGAVAGVPVKPSYVYVSSYQSGAELPVHTDRIQCEYSVTMLIDQTPEPVGQSPWPLYLDCATGRVAIWQGIGDGLLYRGRQLPHHRPRLPEGMTSTSIFFHYVDHDFQGPLD